MLPLLWRNALTPEEEAKVDLVRILVGDITQSIFYPIVTDEEIAQLLELENWDVLRAARRVATTIAFVLASTPYRERTGNIEVWNNASMEYKKVLDQFLKESGQSTLPALLRPYAAGISKADIDKYINDPDVQRSPLAQITPCLAWWTRVKEYPVIYIKE